MSDTRVWTVEIVFTDVGEVTRADAVLDCGFTHYRGWGQAHRNPADPDVPRIGREIAAGRALEDLVHKLLEKAEDDIAEHTGEHFHIHP
ncbi:MAG: DUF1876 domain-containing protein [Acidimicrobiia bacterium]|nr:DUF1876 domain-containing protein [Acidimicrobiia bacterium]